MPTKQVIVIPQHVVSFPVAQGTLINVEAFVSDKLKAGTPFEGRWVSDGTREELEEAFQNFEPAVKDLLKVSYRVESLMTSSTDEHCSVWH